MGRQGACLEELKSLGAQRPLQFYIRNIMWVAYRVGDEHGRLPPIHGPGVRDQHVIRPPQVLPRYNAETVWQALCRLSGGLQEEEEAVPARFSATLTSCDAHRANLKCLRKLHCHLPADHLLLISICTQHRAANCIEALTKAVGNLTGVFCLSKVFNYRNVLVHLRKHVRKRLEQVADRVTERPAANLREWWEAAASAHELVRLCKACLEPQTTEKKHPLDQLLDFFQGPWTGQTRGQ
eukprot:s6345_g2.t1